MEQITSNRRTDAELEALLHESSQWAINGRDNQVLGSAPSLQGAIDRATAFANSGAIVVSLRRHTSEEILVSHLQFIRLRNRLLRSKPAETPNLL